MYGRRGAKKKLNKLLETFYSEVKNKNGADYEPDRLTWDQGEFSFRFVNNIPAGTAKRKESLIQTFYETSAAHFFDWLTFAESANQNYFCCLFF